MLSGYKFNSNSSSMEHCFLVEYNVDIFKSRVNKYQLSKTWTSDCLSVLWAEFRIHWLLLCRGVRPLLTSVLDMTLNNLMVRFQWCLNFGECGVPLHCHRSQVHSGLNRTNSILMLKWIVWVNGIAWNRNIFDNLTVLTFKLRACAKLNCLK